MTLPGWPPKPSLPVILEVEEPMEVAVVAGNIKSKMTGAIAGMATVKKSKPLEKPAPKLEAPKVTVFLLLLMTVSCSRCLLEEPWTGGAR